MLPNEHVRAGRLLEALDARHPRLHCRGNHHGRLGALACACDDIDAEDLIRWDHEDRTYAIYKAEDGFHCTDGMCTHEDECARTKTNISRRGF